jgi:hypothetical protein
MPRSRSTSAHFRLNCSPKRKPVRTDFPQSRLVLSHESGSESCWMLLWEVSPEQMDSFPTFRPVLPYSGYAEGISCNATAPGNASRLVHEASRCCSRSLPELLPRNQSARTSWLVPQGLQTVHSHRRSIVLMQGGKYYSFPSRYPRIYRRACGLQ